MSVVRWERERAIGTKDPLSIDEFDGQVLVLENVSASDDEQLTWCRRAPCVVIACTPAGCEPPGRPDVALVGDQVDSDLEPLLQAIRAHPHACRVLVDVLRPIPEVDLATGLTIESLAYSMLLAGDEFASWLIEQPARSQRTFPGSPVRLDRDGDDLRITLSRPENRNALSAAMRDALFEALAFAELDDTIDCVILAADGPVFSSGGTSPSSAPHPTSSSPTRCAPSAASAPPYLAFHRR